jgi:hypothetical protein
MTGETSSGGLSPDIAKALGLPPRACERIVKEEGATPEDAEEALRRILRHRAYLSHSIRSPGAFFRGVLRGVLDDRAAQARKPPPLPPAPPSPRPDPHGRAYFRAYQLLAAGSTPGRAAAALRQEFPGAPQNLIHDAIAWADSVLGRASDHSHLP